MRLSQGLMKSMAVSPRRRLPPSAGFFTPIWKLLGDHLNVCVRGYEIEISGKAAITGNKKPANSLSGRVSDGNLDVPDSKLPACFLWLLSQTESILDRLVCISNGATMHAMEHTHDRRPIGRLRLLGVCLIWIHVC